MSAAETLVVINIVACFAALLSFIFFLFFFQYKLDNVDKQKVLLLVLMIIFQIAILCS